MLRLIRPAHMQLDGRLEGPTMSVEDLMDLKEDDVLTFDYPIGRQVNLNLNRKLKYRGHIVTAGRKRAFQVDEMYKSG